MSRIAKFPVNLPKGVEVTLAAEAVSIKGPLGSLTQALRKDVEHRTGRRHASRQGT